MGPIVPVPEPPDYFEPPEEPVCPECEGNGYVEYLNTFDGVLHRTRWLCDCQIEEEG